MCVREREREGEREISLIMSFMYLCVPNHFTNKTYYINGERIALDQYHLKL